jgi:prepilin-type N-terminal cleavage/methylation domain-containing protein
MAKTSFTSPAMAWLLRARLTLRGGFTLTELLVAVVVGSLIVSTMLYVVVELLQINRREEVLTQTQQDMRRAIDYITRDAGEAVFIYSTPSAVTNQLDDFPRPGEEPVLAFWRLDPVDPTNPNVQAFFDRDCTTFATTEDQSECSTLKIRQGYYTLVVYALQQNADNDIWGGRSRIVRYELPKYTGAGIVNLTKTAGYSEPAAADQGFGNWTKGPGTTPRNLVVLTDFVDDNDTTQDTTGLCPANYRQTPEDANNFYVCVREGTTAVSTDGSGLTVGSNQTLIVSLRGNASTENSGFVTFSEAGRLPALRSEVLIRGVLDKQPGL